MKVIIARCIECGESREVKTADNYYEEKQPRCWKCFHKKQLEGCGHKNGLKKCTICKQYKPLEDFGRNRTSWDGLSAYCKSCNTIKYYNYYHNHTENARKILDKSMVLHKDRQRARSLSHYFYPARQICETEECFELGERHHDDYKNPHHIKWLCKKHHNMWHQSQLPQYGRMLVET